MTKSQVAKELENFILNSIGKIRRTHPNYPQIIIYLGERERIGLFSYGDRSVFDPGAADNSKPPTFMGYKIIWVIEDTHHHVTIGN